MDVHTPSFLFLFVMIFLCSVFASFTVDESTHGESVDRASLLAFRSKISNDPLGVFSSWNESIDYCYWTGVTCGRRHPTRVTVLNLTSKQLEGTLSPHIGNLSFLRELRLAHNNFSLDIPQELGALFRLQVLRLANNSFSGGIPANISRCSNLKILSLYQNELGDGLPSELRLLSKLQLLDVGYNKLVGKVPSSLGNLSSVNWIDATENKFYGSIPYRFGHLMNLEVLAIGFNELSGSIPESIFNLSSLTQLWVNGNRLNGSLPDDIGLTLPKLKTVVFHTNQFTGPIPTSITNLTFLESFHFSTNRFTGKIPYLGDCRDLRILDFGENDLGTGENDDLSFMSSLLNCTNLEEFYSNENILGGMMPDFLGNFSTKMRRLLLGGNKISGKVPSEIGNLFNLEVLGMEGNLLTGTIPRSIGNLQNMYLLTLAKNKLSGEISSTIGNLTSLGQLDLSQNNLHGSIPPSIGGCISLQLFIVSQNNLSRTIPKELLGISSITQLVLSENILTGSLPLEVGKLENVGILNVSENILSGEIPGTLGRCTSLEYLSLAGNSFHGEIPLALDSLRGLPRLDFSRNNLSGQIPTYFDHFALLSLNLSFNDFEGQVPKERVFSNLSAFSVTGNRKLCGGIPELHLPSCTSKKFKWKLIVALVSGIFGVLLVSYFIFLYMSRKTRRVSTKFSSPMATSILKVSYDDLLKATNGFSPSNLVGIGGFGSVFKGVLGQERTLVAIKILNLARKGATKSFMAECEVLRSIRHKNLVKIITACSSVDFKGNDFKALVYEFMVNGSLEDWLHPVNTSERNEQKYLSFVQRLNIVVDVANALDYLHNECQTTIVHCDLKPSNILIDEDMVAHVGDFGLARLCPGVTQQFASSSLGIKGSVGYAAPEYGMGSEVSTAGDVYSFGVLLLETFIGKRPTDNLFIDGLDLHNFAKIALPEKVMFVADPLQFQSDDQYRSDKFWDCFRSVINLGVACSLESPRERINIKNVVGELAHIKDNLLRTGYIISFHPVVCEG